ncbi:MAG: hypothetical protein VB108_10360 [Anaerolineaceae bacterium]|nr:hypothetical protein [Anaerolineaceae bacterium]
MSTHLYLSLLPEALIFSQLDPDEFGAYYAVGSEKKSRGPAMFLELDPSFRHPYFHLDEALARCKPHEDGSPKASIYVSVYRVLEHTDLDALLKLYLTTADGRTLGLSAEEYQQTHENGLHLYQEIAPVTPLVVSRLDPVGFYDLIVKNPTSLITVPAIAFTELQLGELAQDPVMGISESLPYGNSDHLRQCLSDVKTKYVSTKMVDRISSPVVQYRTVKNGFFFGNQAALKYFRMPKPDELKAENYRWFRSANM